MTELPEVPGRSPPRTQATPRPGNFTAFRIFERKTQRRSEIRRDKAERGLTWMQRLPARVPVRALLHAAVAGVLAGLIVNLGPNPLAYRAGQMAARSITARLDFSVQNQDRSRLLKSRARESAPNYYDLDETLVRDIGGRLANAFNPGPETVVDREMIARVAREYGVEFDEPALDALAKLAADGRAADYQAWITSIVQQLARSPLVESSANVSPRVALVAILVDSQNASGRQEPVSQLLPSDSPDAVLKVSQAAVDPLPEPLHRSIRRAISGQLADPVHGVVRPLFRYDPDRSKQVADEAVAAVAEQYDEYPAGAVLADAGAITPSELALLNSENQAFRAHQAPHAGAMLAPFGAWARGGLAFAIVFGFSAYLLRFRREVRDQFRERLLLSAALLVVLAIARAVYLRTGSPDYVVGLQALAAGLIALTARPGLKSAIACAMALVVVLCVNGDVGLFIALLAVSGVLIGGLMQVRSRGKIVLVSMIASAVVLAISLAGGLLQGQPLWWSFWHCAVIAAAATLAAGFILEGTLPLIERAFGASTAMTLLEWCDANKPLMRIMAGEAPGTYNHSLMVGALAESAAESIAANGLLCRAGAYYHDIGKINKPEYFVENQQFGASRHHKLTPAMSHLVIINHVKDGIVMSREYGLPRSLHPFIAEHHGTTVVEYFYQVAARARRPDAPEVNEVEFRYPGPRPQSRETAILMICDAVEGAVRAMSEPTPARIEETVSRISERRLLDGQFDECELTFRELATVQKAVVKTLNGIYHARIVYPTTDEDEQEETVAAAEVRANNAPRSAASQAIEPVAGPRT